MPFFSPSLNFYQKVFLKKSELGGPVLRIRRGVTPGWGGEKCEPRPRLPLLRLFFEKYFVRYAPPLNPPLDPPFFSIFQFWTTGAPFYKYKIPEICIINVPYAISMCCMHYQRAGFVHYQCAPIMHHKCAACNINVPYAISTCTSYALSMCQRPPLDPPFFLIFSFHFWTTGAPFYIFFFYYITVFLFIFSLFLFTVFSIIEGSAVVIQPPQKLFTATMEVFDEMI